MRYTILHKKQMDYRLPDLYNRKYTSLAMSSGRPTNGVHFNRIRKGIVDILSWYVYARLINMVTDAPFRSLPKSAALPAL